MKRWLLLLLAGCHLALGAESTATDHPEIEAARIEAERLATAEKWDEAVAAGGRLLALRRKELGDDHPDTALADVFLGEVRQRAGAAVLAEPHFRRALAVQEKALKPEAPALVVTLTHLASCLKTQQRYDEAAAVLQRALDLQLKYRGKDHEDTAVAERNLGWIFRLKRDYGRAASLFGEALAIRRSTLGEDDPLTLASLRELAEIHELRGDLPAAEQCAGEWVTGIRKQFGERSEELAAALTAWGALAERQEQFTHAEPRFRRALAIRETLLNADDTGLAVSLTDLGWCLKNLGRYDEAAELLQRALDLRSSGLGPGHEDTAWSYRNLGWVYRLKQDFSRAQQLFERALEIRERALGVAAPLTIASLVELGDLHWLRGAYAEAATLLETRRDRVEKQFGPKSAEAGAAWHSLAILHESAKRWPEAKNAAQCSLEINEQRLGPAHPDTLSELFMLVRIDSAAGDFAAARPHYARLQAWFETHPEADPQRRSELHRQFAIATLRAGRIEEAEPLFQQSRRWHEATFGPNDPATLRSLGDLWTFYTESRQPALALDLARELAARSEQALGADAPATLTVFGQLGQLCRSLGDRTEAALWFRRTLEGMRQRFGTDSEETVAELGRVAGWFEEDGDFAAAHPLRRERLRAIERKFGLESKATAAASGEVGTCLLRLREFAGAREAFQRQLTLLEKVSGSSSPEALAVVGRLGDVAAAEGDWPRAVIARERVAAGLDQRSAQPERGRALLELGEALFLVGSQKRAPEILQEAWRVVQAGGAAQAALAARVECLLGRLSVRQGNPAAASSHLRAALTIEVQAPDEVLAGAFASFGAALARTGQLPEAERASTRALELFTKLMGDRDERSISALQQSAIIQLRLGRGDAGPLLARALAASEVVSGLESPATADLLGWVALADAQEGRLSEAGAAAERMLRLKRGAFAEEGAEVALAQAVNAWVAFKAGDVTRWCPALDATLDFAEQNWGALHPYASGAARSWTSFRALLAPGESPIESAEIGSRQRPGASIPGN
ncbi:MAG: hypothetical protein QOE70_460 [Chthoniobacter sp.]|jgi:tetratricopeptide (TPR) repeat protein|nr:hypothetical protein [Chthoniobacter sp.]